MAMDQATCKRVMDHVHGSATMTVTAPLRLRQMTANGSATANGTELATAGGYTAGTGAPTITYGAATTATPSVSSNSAAVTITNMPAATVVGIEVWESNATTPYRIEQAALTTSKTTALGDTLSYAIGAVTSSLQ
jgi:hypothetical protein